MSYCVTIPRAVPPAVLLAIVGCAGISELAPPVGERALREAAMLDISAGRLQRGRAIYITTCTRCHSPEPVAGYTLAQWRQTLPRMSERSKLTAQETADLRDYVTITLRALASPRATPADGATDPGKRAEDVRMLPGAPGGGATRCTF